MHWYLNIDYIIKKDYHSIVLQGLVDNNYIFHDVCCSSLLLLMAVCCSLHNVCELKKEEFFKDWLQNIDIDLGENISYPGICCGFGLGNARGNKEFH